MVLLIKTNAKSLNETPHKHIEITPEQFAWALAGLSVGWKMCKWENSADAMSFIERKYLEDLTEYDTGGRYVQLVDRSVDTMLRPSKSTGCAQLAQS
jgi:hypothetical protein